MADRADGSDGDDVRLEVGRIGKAHGLRGEVVVHLTSNRTERVAPGSVLHADAAELTVETAREQSPGRWIVRFAGLGSREDAEAHRGLLLTAPPLEGLDDELWVHELVGATAVEADGTVLGPVTAVQDNPASDLLVIDTERGEVLVPLVFVVEQEPGRVVLSLPEGLLDLGG